jgi:hypothetical protein
MFMRNPQGIITQIREDVLKFHQELQQKMIALSKEGLLTKGDMSKIELNVKATLDALSRAFNDTVHHESFREEWLLNVVKSYENEALKLIKEIENRRYTDKLIAIRIDAIKHRILSQTPLSSNEHRGRIEGEVAKLEKQLWEDIHGIPQKHSRRSQLIETWLQEFEDDTQSLSRLHLKNGY